MRQQIEPYSAPLSQITADSRCTVEPTLVRAAIQAGVKRFMPSEYTFDITHPAARVLGEGNLIGERVSWADRLSRIASEGQISYTTLVTGSFLDWGLKGGMLGFKLAQQKAELYDKGEHTATGCTVGFVANAIIASLMLPGDETKNKRLYIAEVEYTGQEMLEMLQEVTGTKWEVTEVSTQYVQQKAQQLQVEGNLRGAYVNYAVALNFNGCGVADLRTGLDFGRPLSLQRQTLERIIRHAIGGFTETAGRGHVESD